MRIKPPLTESGWEMLSLFAHGYSLDNIALRMHFSRPTIRARLDDVVATMGAQNTHHAAALAAANGWIRIQEAADVTR